MSLNPQHRLDLVLVWHMHQPDYRTGAERAPSMPWVYLHALKDYADMAAHLERHPGARAVVNFAPVLLEQLDDYAQQFATGRLRDALLRLLARDDGVSFTDEERRLVLRQCFHANHEHMLAPFPAYRRLREIARIAEQDADRGIAYLSDRYLLDLVTWYHLAWTGETVRREAPLATELMHQGGGFTPAQRQALLELIGRVVGGVVARYRRLEESGRIELSTTPYFHPLAPLLIDFECARQARPGLPLPAAARYPGGGERLAWHIEAALAAHAARFGRAPTGLWPAEGAVSDAVLAAAGQAGLAWIASGEQVLAHSVARAGMATGTRDSYLYRAWRVPAQASGTLCFFRDDRLSDQIGFVYRSWDGVHAARHFVGQLEAIAAHADPARPAPIVSVILDGENPWEHYPYNGYYFLDALYGALEAHPSIRMRTFRDWIAERGDAGDLPGLVAGSWVYGDLATWIGAPEKNAAWDLLVEAKQAFDAAIAAGTLNAAERAAAERQLAVCESSDWFWWLGDYNPAESVATFDRLYREQLAELYRRLHLVPPTALDAPLARGTAGRPGADGAMRRAA